MSPVTQEEACAHLLDPQTEVEDAVRAVGLSIGPSHFLDEASQSKAQLSRVALKDVFFNIYWGQQIRHNVTSGSKEDVLSLEHQRNLTLFQVIASLLNPALPGFNPIQVVHFRGSCSYHHASVRWSHSPSPLDGCKCNEYWVVWEVG